MHRLLLIILSVFIIVACSVSNKVDTELAEIEEIMNDHPDSALYRLQQIDTNTLNTDRREALYRLLYSQALDINLFNDKSCLKWYETDGVHKAFVGEIIKAYRKV